MFRTFGILQFKLSGDDSYMKQVQITEQLMTRLETPDLPKNRLYVPLGAVQKYICIRIDYKNKWFAPKL